MKQRIVHAESFKTRISIRRPAPPSAALVALIAVFWAAFSLMLLPAAALAEGPHVVATLDTDSCASCHSTHAQSTALTPGLGVVADGQPSAVCLPCHATDSTGTANIVSGSRDSFGLASGHSLVSSSTGNVQLTGCGDCHDTHGASSNEPMLPAKTINGANVSASGTSVCLACHTNNDDWFGPGYPSTSAPVRNAAGYPVLGTWPGASVYTSNTNAHRLIPESTQTVTAGGVKRSQGDCLYCHAAHRGPNTYDDLLTTFTVPAQSTLASDKADGSYAALCFTCHSAGTPNGFSAPMVDIQSFVTTSDPSAGHTVQTAGGALPVGSPLPCFECHGPHGSARGNASLLSDELGGSLETSTSTGVRRFCFTCHTTSDTSAGWDSSASAYAVVSPNAEVVGLPRGGAQLHLSATGGHALNDTQSCYDCHGASYSPGGNNVHDPAASGQLSLQVLGGSSLTATDTTPPTTTADLTASYSGLVSLVATDSGSGVDQTYYSLDAGVLTTGTVVSTSQDGTHTLQFWSVDRAGNVEAPSAIEFLVDRTAPVTSSDATSSYIDSATITLTSVDNTAGTGVVATHYSLDGSTTETGTVVTVTAPGDHTLQFWSVDGAGNAEVPLTVTFTISASQALSDQPPPAALRVESLALAPPGEISNSG